MGWNIQYFREVGGGGVICSKTHQDPLQEEAQTRSRAAGSDGHVSACTT